MATVQEPCNICKTQGGWIVDNPDGKGGAILMLCKACGGKGWVSKNV